MYSNLEVNAQHRQKINENNPTQQPVLICIIFKWLTKSRLPTCRWNKSHNEIFRSLTYWRFAALIWTVSLNALAVVPSIPAQVRQVAFKTLPYPKFQLSLIDLIYTTASYFDRKRKASIRFFIWDKHFTDHNCLQLTRIQYM